MDMHYCQNEIQSVSVFGKAKACDKMADHNCDNSNQECHKADETKSKDASLKSCHSQMSGEKSEKDCCQNKSIQIDNLDEDSLSVQITSFGLSQIQFVVAFVSSFYTDSDLIQAFPFNRFLTYNPPLIEKDIQVLFQSFLI